MASPVVRVEAVCVSTPDRRVAKVPRAEVLVEQFGFAGDRHAGEQRASPRTGQPIRNTRQWSAVSTEEVEAFCEELGAPAFPPGSLGENLRLSGIVLADARPGTVLEFPSGARLAVTGQNDPCENAARELGETFGPNVERYFVKASFGHRGVIGTVVATGVIRPGDEVRVVLPEAARAGPAANARG